MLISGKLEGEWSPYDQPVPTGWSMKSKSPIDCQDRSGLYVTSKLSRSLKLLYVTRNGPVSMNKAFILVEPGPPFI